MDDVRGGLSTELWLEHTDEAAAQSALQALIWEEIRRDPLIARTDLLVDVADGVATLHGTVPSYVHLRHAAGAAGRVPGVRGLAILVEVVLDPATARDDAELAAAVRGALEARVDVPPDDLDLRVDGGVVYLGGDVDRTADRLAIEDVVAGLCGVRAIVDRIEVHPQYPFRDEPPAVELVTSALASAGVHARHLRVEVTGDRVVLRGEVPCLAERDAAERTLSWMPGVAAVDDRLAVRS